MLTPLQQRLAAIVRELPEASGFALAGAGGLLVRGLIERPTRDLDYFTVPGEDDAVIALRDSLEHALDRAGLDHTRHRDLATFVRVEVSDGHDRCEIDLAIDYRALPTEPSSYGPTLAVEELAANKVLALFDRAEARDFLDLAELTRHFELQSLMDLAAQKDTGFTTDGFLEALSSFRRLTTADFGIGDTEYEHLRATVASWQSHLGRQQGRERPDRGLGFDR
ncbi:MAG: nucleotidyl transferase AbiEii/AbiGii toxin family protein [bacterium]|nr:nucleotidyl transferase AbiEii/AbiGii toxin family protein [bacterium]